MARSDGGCQRKTPSIERPGQSGRLEVIWFKSYHVRMHPFEKRWLTTRARWAVFLLAVGASLVLTGLALWSGRTARIRFTEQQVNAIQPGVMREEQVVAFLGMPPGDYSTGPHPQLPIIPGSGPPCYRRDWISDDGCILVFFRSDPNAKGMVAMKAFFDWRPTAIQRGLSWLRWFRAKIGV
jgi:hypothetical protein